MNKIRLKVRIWLLMHNGGGFTGPGWYNVTSTYYPNEGDCTGVEIPEDVCKNYLSDPYLGCTSFGGQSIKDFPINSGPYATELICQGSL